MSSEPKSSDSMDSMNANERVAVSSLAFLFSVRMLGLFMVMPIISVYGQSLVGASPKLLGIAIGIYGLTQAMLQIPFGWLSDRVGRKPIILFGLSLFVIGGLIAANSEHIFWLIIGRAMQGAGAVASTIMALLADLTREEVRSKAMGAMGASIGLSFAVALVVGPALAGWVGLQGVFYVIAGLGVAGVLICQFLVPNPQPRLRSRDVRPVMEDLKGVLLNEHLSRINAGVFILHSAMSAFFLAIPLVLRDQLGIDIGGHWKIYLPVLFLSFLLMIPFILIAEKYRKMHQIVRLMIGILVLSQAILLLGDPSLWLVVTAVGIYFVGFNTLEALLPSWLSKLAPAGKRGTCMGVFSTSQFLGAFFGGWLSGIAYEAWGPAGVFAGLVVIFCAWVGIAFGMKPPPFLKSFSVSISGAPESRYAALEKAFAELSGVSEVVIYVQDQVAHLKINPEQFSSEHVLAIKDEFRLS